MGFIKDAHFFRRVPSDVSEATKSGGVEREWVGHPRIYQPKLDPKMDGDDGASERCVCAPSEQQAEPYLEEYEGCAPDAHKCHIGKPS